MVNIILDYMYRIYMPVDMVLAITHSKMRRERVDMLYKERIESMRLADVAMTSSYEKRDERDSREKIGKSCKNSNYIDMFQFW